MTRYLWSPSPIQSPQIDPDLHVLSWPERTAEVIAFTFLSIEYWVSKGGVLREWLRLNLWIAVILTLVSVLLVPPITALLEAGVEWTALGGRVVGNITDTVLKLPPIVLAIATLLIVAKIIQRQWLKRRRPRGHRDHHYDDYH